MVFIFSLLATSFLAAETKVLLFAGSTRTESVNKKLINESAEILKSLGATTTVVDLRDMPIPFYDGDLEAESGMPENAKKLKSLMLQSDVVVISTPEYNGSIPAVLKNAIDWMSRKESGGSSRDAYTGKKFILLSTSPGSSGGKRGLAHLKAVIDNISKGQALELSIPNAAIKDNKALREVLIEGMK